MITGTGFMIWQRAKCPLDVAIPAAKRAKATHVCIKTVDGMYLHNAYDTDKGLRAYIEGWRAAGFDVGQWSFPYPLPTLSPGAQSALFAERWQKFDFAYALVDAEQVTSLSAFWKTLANGKPNYENKKSAKVYMEQLRYGGMPLRVPVALCSYRYPTLHAPFPFKQFLDDEHSTFTAPQLYWIGDTRPNAPHEQLTRSITEYDAIRKLPMVPVGAAFGANNWEPTVAQLSNFMGAVRSFRLPGCLFWSLDYVIAHQRVDWLDAIAGKVEPSPPPPPPTPVEGDTLTLYVRNDALPYLNARVAPDADSQDLGDLYPGTKIVVNKISGVNAWVQIAPGERYAGAWVCMQLGEYRFLETTPV